MGEHPEMKGCDSYVAAAIRAPMEVHQDRSFPTRRIIYKPFVLPKPMHLQYLRVVVEYKHLKLRNRYQGYVRTAFPVSNRRKGDILLWSQLSEQ